MGKVVVRKPRILKPVLSPKKFKDLQKFLLDIPKEQIGLDSSFGRYAIGDEEFALLGKMAKELTPVARKFFKSKTLVPSYTLFAHYEGQGARLGKHKDDNACSYTLDFCVYQKHEWPIWVENKEYTVKENQALGFYGNDQLHWREEFPQPKTNQVGMIFFHFVEPEHWYYTKGPGHINKIRKGKSAYK